jgi:hypothetical protein
MTASLQLQKFKRAQFLYLHFNKCGPKDEYSEELQEGVSLEKVSAETPADIRMSEMIGTPAGNRPVGLRVH